jgi:hypothetical protein
MQFATSSSAFSSVIFLRLQIASIQIDQFTHKLSNKLQTYNKIDFTRFICFKLPKYR